MKLLNERIYHDLTQELTQEIKRVVASRSFKPDLTLFYQGEPPETGGTAIVSRPSPPIKFLRRGHFFNCEGEPEGNVTILLYGAGKGRNAKYLRGEGYKVYAYDPFHGDPDVDGYVGTTSVMPQKTFDVGVTAYVLNVVPKAEEDKIIKRVKKLSKRQFHITRNWDVYESISKALRKGSKTVCKFFKEEYAPNHPMVEDFCKEDSFPENIPEDLFKKIVLDFCRFGSKTIRGFQRIPILEDQGFHSISKDKNYRIYSSEEY